MNRLDWNLYTDDATAEIHAQCAWCSLIYSYPNATSLDNIMRDITWHNSKMHPIGVPT